MLVGKNSSLTNLARFGSFIPSYLTISKLHQGVRTRHDIPVLCDLLDSKVKNLIYRISVFCIEFANDTFSLLSGMLGKLVSLSYARYRVQCIVD